MPTFSGSLGIPRVPLLEKVGLQEMGMRQYQFFDTALEDCVENAFQALALDERRSAFTPAVWEKKAGNKSVSYDVETVMFCAH